jgi:hypothetical protein
MLSSLRRAVTTMSSDVSPEWDACGWSASPEAAKAGAVTANASVEAAIIMGCLIDLIVLLPVKTGRAEFQIERAYEMVRPNGVLLARHQLS